MKRLNTGSYWQVTKKLGNHERRGMNKDVTEEYFAALARIESGRPKIVAKSDRITNDLVSIEAGRSKGSIKKSRPQFSILLSAIREAAAEQAVPQNSNEERARKNQRTIDSLSTQLDAALARENSLVLELYELRQKMAHISGERILPLRRTVPNQ